MSRYDRALYRRLPLIFLGLILTANASSDHRGLQGSDAPDVVNDTPSEDSAGPPPLTAGEVVAVANSLHAHSADLARHYLSVRDVPENQLLVTGMSLLEHISRTDYDRQIAGPLREFLVAEKLDHVRCVVLVHGVPLKILEPIQTPEQRRLAAIVQDERRQRLESLIGVVEQAHTLARPPGQQPSLTPLDYDPAESFNEQMHQLHQTAREEFNLASGRIGALEAGAAHEHAAPQWTHLWHKAYGLTPPETLGVAPVAVIDPQTKERLQKLRLVRELLAEELEPIRLRQLLEGVTWLWGAVGALDYCDDLELRFNPDPSYRASVDSELATLFWPPFPLANASANPFHLEADIDPPGRTLMVCRLDGPNEIVVRGMIDTSVAVERRGLQGRAYIDARGRNDEGAYGQCDRDLVRLGEFLAQRTSIPTTLDREERLFQPGECPEAALYAGWYSLANYIDAFTFKPGAIGIHVASTEAASLRGPGSTLWCPQLLSHGAVATVGAVGEPYLWAFPRASEFFGLLLTGRYPLVECYYLSLPNLSWKMTLIGDPLYNPFAARPVPEAAALVEREPD